MYILEKAGLYTQKGYWVWLVCFHKICVGYYNNALKDTKLVKKKQKKQKNLIVEDRPAFPEGIAKNLQDLV